MSSILRVGFLALLFGVSGRMAHAVDCRTVAFEAQNFVVCKVDATQQDLRIFHSDPETQRLLGSFGNVSDLVEKDDRALVFAMNAGMYHSNRQPVGLFIEDGETKTPVVTSDGPGNFGLLPNGVFCIRSGRADVIETRTFVREKPECRFASQSGPMLVIDGHLHPRFLEKSDSLYIRNGVGTSEDGRSVYFAISETPVNFHTFGRLYRDVLKTPQALYLDGNISRLFAPDLDRRDGGFPMGPIVGVVSDRD
ncbi:MAG: phosphodiester glycosidase family protein [Pseudomonadota bacterium]